MQSYVQIVTESPMSGTKIKKFVLCEQLRAELRASGITTVPKLETGRKESQ